MTCGPHEVSAGGGQPDSEAGVCGTALRRTSQTVDIFSPPAAVRYVVHGGLGLWLLRCGWVSVLSVYEAPWGKHGEEKPAAVRGIYCVSAGVHLGGCESSLCHSENGAAGLRTSASQYVSSGFHPASTVPELPTDRGRPAVVR